MWYMYLVCATLFSWCNCTLVSQAQKHTRSMELTLFSNLTLIYPYPLCLKKLESSERSVITEAAKMSKEDHFKPLSPQAEEAKRLSTFLFPDADRSVRINRKVQSCGGRSWRGSYRMCFPKSRQISI